MNNFRIEIPIKLQKNPSTMADFKPTPEQVEKFKAGRKALQVTTSVYYQILHIQYAFIHILNIRKNSTSIISFRPILQPSMVSSLS